MRKAASEDGATLIAAGLDPPAGARHGAEHDVVGAHGPRFSSRPVAARMAATMAGVLEIAGGSPTPFAPYGASGCECSMTSHTTGGGPGCRPR